MGDARPGLDQPRELAIRQVDGVGEDRPRPEAAGAVVDVDVVERLGEQPRDLRDLAAILRHVGLPVRAGRAASAADSRSISAEQETANRGVTA